MSFVAVAIGSGTAATVGIGGSIASGLIGSNAAKSAAAQQESALMLGLQNTNNLTRNAVDYLSPYAQNGIGVGDTLSSLFVDPTTKYNQLNAQRTALQGTVDKYSTAADFASTPLLTGKNASERRQQAYDQMEFERKQNLQNAQNQLKTFDAQYTPDYLDQLKSGTDPNAPKLQESPFLTQLSDLTTRNVNRALAARGGYNSGAAYEAIGNALAPLNYGAYQFGVNNLMSLYGTGAGAAGNQASITAGMAPTIAGLYQGIGNAQAQGTLGAANAEVNAISGGVNSINGAVGALGQASLYNSLINKLGTQNNAGNVANAGGGGSVGGWDLRA